MPPLYFCMGLDFTLRNNLSKPLWRGIPLLTLSLIVRFLHVIGQPPMPTDSACPILPHYRTTSKTISLRLSDFSALSDNHHRSSVLQRNLFHEFGHVLEGVATILQGFIDFA